MGTSVSYYLRPDITPNPKTLPMYDAHYGYKPGARKEKVMVATDAELESMKLEQYQRDYCAHVFIDFRACLKDKFPQSFKCEHKKEAYVHCISMEHMDRMRDFERERRLMVRRERILKKQAEIKAKKKSEELKA